MTRNPNYLTDGATTLLGGVDEGREPLLLEPNKVSRAINITMRKGFPRTRPGFVRRGLNFERGEYAAWFHQNLFQGYGYYDDFRGMEKIICSVGGRIFLIDPAAGFMMTDITPRKHAITTANFTTDTPLVDVLVTVDDANLIFEGYPIYINGFEFQVMSKSGNILTVRTMEQATATLVVSGADVEYLDPNSPNLPLAWMEQAEQYMVIQDDQARAIIFDGSTTRRAEFGTEVPTGSVMAYGRGRLWVAVNNGQEFVAGDIAGGTTGVLGFTENDFLSGGGAFRIGANVGRIRAMKFVMNLDTSLGQGPLQVLCERAIYSVNAPTNREAWSTITDPIQTESLINFGATGHYSTVLVNGDLFFRAEDGLRSFFIARRDFGTWGNTPISREVSKTLADDTQELLVHSAAVLFDNRLLFTAVPQPGTYGVRHKALVALDFDVISTMASKSPPAYDGFWTGIDVTGVLTGRFAGRNRCFAFVHSSLGLNEIWEITTDDKFDNGSYPIDWRIEYRSMYFPRAGGLQSGLKRLEAAELWVSEFSGEVAMTLSYKPDQHPCWQTWATKTICVTSDQCDETSACDSTTASSNMLGYKTRLSFGKPADGNIPADEKALPAGFSFQVAIDGSGYVQLNKLILHAHEVEEWAIAPPSDDRSACSAIACCPPDPFEYRAMCGQPDAPIARQFTTFNGLGEYYAQFPVVAGCSYQVRRETPTQVEQGLLITPTTTALYTYEILRIAAIGQSEKVWVVASACGLCSIKESPKIEVPVVY